jgi:hypothetical protein
VHSIQRACVCGRLGQGLLEVDLPALHPLAQFGELLLEFVVLEELELRVPLVDSLDAFRGGLELLRFAQPQGALEDGHSY